MAATTSGNPQTDLLSLLSDTSSKWTAASIASQLTVPLLSSLPSQLPALSPPAVRVLLLALLQCRPAVLAQARDVVPRVLDECDRSEDEWVRWLARRLRDYESTDTQPTHPSEQDRAMVRRVQQAVRVDEKQSLASQQQHDKEERKEENEPSDTTEQTARSASSTPLSAVHGSVYLPCLPYHCHFLSPELLPSELTTSEPLPLSAPSSLHSSSLRLVSPPAVHFTVRRRFIFFDQHSTDDTTMTDVDGKDSKVAAVSTSPAPPAVFVPPAVPASPATPTASVPALSSSPLPSSTPTTSTPRRIALPSTVPHMYPRPLQSPSSASSPLAIAASRLGTRPSLPPSTLVRQPSLTRPMSNPASNLKAGRGVVMIGLEEAGGLTDVKQRVRDEKEKERREKEEEKRMEAERKKEERDKEKREKEEEKRVEAEKRREEKEEKDRQRRAEKEEKERKRLEWHRVREEKAKVREEKKKRDEEVHKQTEEDTVPAAQQQIDGERKETEESVDGATTDSSTRGEEEQKHPTQTSAAEQQHSIVDGQRPNEHQPAEGRQQSLTSMDIDSASHTPSDSTQSTPLHGTPHGEQQQQPQHSNGHSVGTSPVHSPPLHPLPALPSMQVSLDSDEAKRKRREDRKRRKQEKQERQQQTAADQPPVQQASEDDEKEQERKKRKKEKRKREKALEKERSGEKADGETGKAAAKRTVVKRHKPSCKRKA